MLSTQEVIDNFEFLEDWEARYAYLVELGEALPPLDESLRTDANLVKGCVSKVWVTARPSARGGDRVDFVGDCDTAIIKGILALLIELMSGRGAAEIEALDVDRLFETLNLAENLSPNRHFGVYAIVDQMKSQAAALTAADAHA